MNKLIGLIYISMCLSSTAFGLNTFVGNGGSAGDIERLVTEKQVLQTMQSLASSDGVDEVCTCEFVFKNHLECTPLMDLSKEQKRYCSVTLKSAAVKVRDLLESKSVRFNWTKEDIYVRDDGQTITADAVANPKNKIVTINQKRFLSLPATKRLFLLTHEILHLVPLEDKLVGDSEELGPFTGKQGTRKLLNAMAAGTVMAASSRGVLRRYKRALRRRKAYRNHWFDFDLALSGDMSSSDNVYALDSYSGFALKYKRYFGRLGFNVSFEQQNDNEGLLSSSEIKERNQIFGTGFSYKIMPFKNPLSFWGQSFINIDANLEVLYSSLKVSDTYTSVESSMDSLGWSGEVKYYIPLRPFWVHIGVGLRGHDYTHSIGYFSDAVEVKKDSIQNTFKLGVSYAF